jgi:hypothetical protein
MGEIFPIPTVGDVFSDMRGDDRRMRVSYHEDPGVVVVSLWADTVCRGTFRLAARDVTRLIAVLSHVELSADATSMPDDHDMADAEANVVTPQLVTPAPEQTGDVNRAAVPPVRAPRVA